MKNWIDTWMEPEGIIGYHWIPEGIQMFFFVQDDMTNTEILSKFSFLFKNKIWRDILIIPILFFLLSGTHLFLVTQRNSSVPCKDVNVRKQ